VPKIGALRCNAGGENAFRRGGRFDLARGSLDLKQIDRDHYRLRLHRSWQTLTDMAERGLLLLHEHDAIIPLYGAAMLGRHPW
jgi:hypothetical protein